MGVSILVEIIIMLLGIGLCIGSSHLWWITTHLKHVYQGKVRLSHPRSGRWSEFKLQYGKIVPKVCEACGSAEFVELHHIVPFRENPDKECDPLNVIWLCEGPAKCHLRIGHGLNYRGWNVGVVDDAQEFLVVVRESSRLAKLESKYKDLLKRQGL